MTSLFSQLHNYYDSQQSYKISIQNSVESATNILPGMYFPITKVLLVLTIPQLRMSSKLWSMGSPRHMRITYRHDLCILCLNNRWTWVVNPVIQPLLGLNCQYPMGRMLGNFQNHSERNSNTHANNKTKLSDAYMRYHFNSADRLWWTS